MPMLVDMCYFMLKSYCISMFRMLLCIHVSSGVLIKPISLYVSSGVHMGTVSLYVSSGVHMGTVSLYVSSVVHSGTFGVHRKVTINT